MISVEQLKREQRAQLLQTRGHLPAWYQKHCSEQICNIIQCFVPYKRAMHLALYRAYGREISLDPLWHIALAEGKTCYFPILHANHDLSFSAANESDIFQKNKHGILEPQVEISSSLPPLDIIFLPLLGFDNQGNRLGSGAGCYDRTLRKMKKTLYVGIGYAFQQLKQILVEETDVPLDLIITEAGIMSPYLEKKS